MSNDFEKLQKTIEETVKRFSDLADHEIEVFREECNNIYAASAICNGEIERLKKENSFMAGKEINDFVERFEKGYVVLSGDDHHSTDYFQGFYDGIMAMKNNKQ